MWCVVVFGGVWWRTARQVGTGRRDGLGRLGLVLGLRNPRARAILGGARCVICGAPDICGTRGTEVGAMLGPMRLKF